MSSRDSNDSSGSTRINRQPAYSGLDLAEATSYTSCDPTKPILLRLEVRGSQPSEFYAPITVPNRFHQIVQTYPNEIAIQYQIYEDGRASKSANGSIPSSSTHNKCSSNTQPIDLPWYSVTYQQYLKNVRQTAKAFLAVGLQAKHSVGIMGFNSPEWFYSNFGAIFAGGLSTGIYATNNDETCFHILNDSGANVIVVEDTAQMNKIHKIRHRLPNLKAAVQYRGHLEPYANTANPTQNDNTENHGTPSNFQTYMWDDFMKKHKEISDDTLDQIIGSLKANMCCSLIYTSGTTGNPKGVMLSHDNCTWTAHQTAKMLHVKPTYECLLSYLPMSHIAAQIIDLYLALETANAVYFAHPDVLKGTLVNYLKYVRPTIFIGVPRVWEKISEKMQDVGRTSTGVKKKIATWAKSLGTTGSECKMRGESLPLTWTLANMLVFKKIRKALGFDRCTYMVSAGAPLAKETRLYLASLNLHVMEVYGMSECTGPATLNANGVGRYWGDSVGLPLIGAQVRISGQDYEDNTGEVCMRGRHVFMGYIHREAETQDTIDKDGWLKSGDLGKLENTETASNFLFITGRIKELIITAGGENVAPVPIEDEIKRELHDLVSNAMVIGDFKKHLSLLLTVRTEADSTGLPNNILAQNTRSWLKSVTGADIDSLTQLLKDPPPKMNKAIDHAIKVVNDKGISRAANIRKWRIVPRDFSVVGGELGPTLKLRRPIVAKMYADLIVSIYQDEEAETQKNQHQSQDATTNGPTFQKVPPKQGLNLPGGMVITESNLNLKHSDSYITHI